MRRDVLYAPIVAVVLGALVFVLGLLPAFETEPDLLVPGWLPSGFRVAAATSHAHEPPGEEERPLALAVWGRLGRGSRVQAAIFASAHLTSTKLSVRCGEIGRGCTDVTVRGHSATLRGTRGENPFSSEDYEGVDPGAPEQTRLDAWDGRVLVSLMARGVADQALVRFADHLVPHPRVRDGTLDVGYVPRGFRLLGSGPSLSLGVDATRGTRVFLTPTESRIDDARSPWIEIEIVRARPYNLWGVAWGAEGGYWGTVRGRRTLIISNAEGTQLYWNESRGTYIQLIAPRVSLAVARRVAESLRPVTEDQWKSFERRV